MAKLLILIACLALSVNAQLSASEQNDMVAAHNTLRNSLEDCSDMTPLMWDADLASVAQTYLDGLAGPSWPHNGDRTAQYATAGGSGYVGENIAMGTNTAAADAPGMWTTTQIGGTCSEQSNWWTTYASQNGLNEDTQYATGGCSKTSTVGHYTQVLWSATTRVGCGKREGVPMPWGGNGNVIMCNYNPGGNFNAPTYEYCAMGTKCSACPSTHQQGCVDDSGTSGSGAAFGLCSNGGVLASPPPPPADPEPQSGSSNCPMGSDEVGQQVGFCATYKAYCSQYGDAMTVDWSDGKKYGLTQICPNTCACEAAPPSWGGSSNCGECAAHSEYGANNPQPTYPEPSYATTVTLNAASGGVTSDDDTSNDRLTTSEVIGVAVGACVVGAAVVGVAWAVSATRTKAPMGAVQESPGICCTDNPVAESHAVEMEPLSPASSKAVKAGNAQM